MTNKEFSTWLYEHKAAFPGFAQWLAKLGPDTPDEPGTKATVAKWQAQFRKITIDAARRATRRMQDGLLKSDWPSEYFQTVFNDAQTTDREAREERKGIDCQKCRDELWVPILDRGALKLCKQRRLSEAIDWWRKRHNSKGGFPVKMAYCDCERGSYQANHESNKGRFAQVKDDDVVFVSSEHNWRSMNDDEFIEYCEDQTIGGFGEFVEFADPCRVTEF